MARFTHKAQVLLTEDQFQGLREVAEREDKPMGALLREAAEEVWLKQKRQWDKKRAVEALLALPEIEAPEDYQEWEQRYLDERASKHS